MKSAFTLAALCILGAAVGQRPALPTATSTWLGCERHDFEVDGRACWVVAPRVRAAGNPWVWRARFPQFHTELDEALLEEGLHIAYLDTAGMLGSPRALDHWDRFYDDMIQRGFARGVALEAVSRGGLFAYRWAARHPERVACIYADTPVCDIKSWPLGQGAGLGHAATWQSLLEEYGFTRQQALGFDGNPIDLAATLAAAQIPLLHIVSENDQVVPPAENTYVLQARLREHGGDLEVLSVPTGSAESHGHHFAVRPEHVRRASEFVLRHTHATPANARYHSLRGGLGRSHARLAAGGACRVAFLGGSITHNPGWRDHVAADLQRRFPQAEIEFVNAGIPSMG